MFWQVLLNIILFLISLTVLVSIHELGHLTMAKVFNVYCEEYSIGFGPKIFQIKPSGTNKKGKPRETTFSVRAIPLGGYVSMAGEGMEDDEKLSKLPKERFLNGVARWKRAIIMVAGVTLNAILGVILLFIGYCSTPTIDLNAYNFEVSNKVTYIYYDEINIGGKQITEDSLASIAGLTSSTKLKEVVITYSGNLLEVESTSKDGKTINYKDVTLDSNSKTYVLQDQVDDNPGGTYVVINDEFNTKYYPKDNNSTKTFKFVTVDNETIEVVSNAYASTRNVTDGVVSYNYKWHLIGISNAVRSRSVGEIFSQTGKTFVEYSTILYKTIGELFVGKGLDNLGGPIAIVQQQVSIASYGFGYFMLFWGLISINLAVINLLPFPGLDGWHLLIVIIESITRKEVSPKVKNVVSLIGLGLLFILMIFITIKDILRIFLAIL